jgi:deoxyribodipyrimidine photolyase-related protein
LYPHHLYEPNYLKPGDEVTLVEEPLYFTQYRFHKKKLILHRASMKSFARQLSKVNYIEASDLTETSDIAKFVPKDVIIFNPVDDWLTKRLKRALPDAKFLESPNFYNLEIPGKLFFSDFYQFHRRNTGLLMDKGKPVGGKYSFDTDNRKKLPRGLIPPQIFTPESNEFVREAEAYVSKFNTVGESENFNYPITRDEALCSLDNFIQNRLSNFGDYEDAISASETFLFHSVLAPSLNIGLLSPRELVNAALKADVPINSKEGFIRQVFGWREFIKSVYLKIGSSQRTTNFWNFKNKMPKSFYDGTTGILPFDTVVRRVLKEGYCHHIERLMVLGSFMLLCEIEPDSVYQWFMEFFVDAYDWVMVPNVYGMSQYADGGLMTTKPYICGSSYIKKMSNFPSGEWCEIWDGLYWRFIERHQDFFKVNPRMSVMVNQLNKLDSSRRDRIKFAAEQFLSKHI